VNFTAEIPATITQDQLDDVLREAASAARGVPSRDAGPGVPPTRPLEGVPGRELRVIPLQGSLDLIEPALVALGERHDSFCPPGTRWTSQRYVRRLAMPPPATVPGVRSMQLDPGECLLGDDPQEQRHHCHTNGDEPEGHP
jgi:hypothetical protein